MGIRRHIQNWLDLWERREFEALAEDTVATNRQQKPTVQRQETEENVRKVFVHMLL